MKHEVQQSQNLMEKVKKYGVLYVQEIEEKCCFSLTSVIMPCNNDKKEKLNQ